MRHPFVLGLGLLLICTVIGCDDSASEGSSTVNRLSIEDTFRLHCSTCHGDGSGNGHIAATLKLRPRNLKHKKWQASVTDAHILKTIREGGKVVNLSPDMPAFQDKLDKQQLSAMVQYIRRLGR